MLHVGEGFHVAVVLGFALLVEVVGDAEVVVLGVGFVDDCRDLLMTSLSIIHLLVSWLLHPSALLYNSLLE